VATAPEYVDVETQGAAPYTVSWWLGMLEDALVARIPVIDKYEAYYAGQHNLAFATSKFREAFGRLFRTFSDNWTELVVDASVERISVQGFRFNAEDIQGDTDAWEMWQANGLDSDSVIGHTTAVKTGWSYIMVGPGALGPNGDTPEITIEHPCEVIVAMRHGSRRQRAAALKRWIDDLGFMNWTVYLPEALYRFQSVGPITSNSGPPRRAFVEAIENPLGIVPIVPLVNDPDGRGYGTSDIDQVIPTQDVVNKLWADLMVTSEFSAYRQRIATGIEVDPSTPAGQKLINDLASGASRVWTIEDPNAKVTSLEASDLKNYIQALEAAVQHIAARTRTPPHYLLGSSGAFPSGESLKATETGLVAKVRKKHIFFGEAWEEAMRLAFLLKNDKTRGLAVSAETIWKDPESRSEGELVDALTKMATLGVPHEALWERWGATPQQIARWKSMQLEAAFTQALTVQQTLPLPPGTPAPTGAQPKPGDPAATGIAATVPAA
jgi:hypothetical protein